MEGLQRLCGQGLADARVILLAGFPGVGKSTVARWLEGRHGYTVVCSYDVRVRAFPWLRAAGHRGTPASGAELSLEREWIYLELARLALVLVRNGHRVVVDATNTDGRREKLLAAFDDLLPAPGDLAWLVVRRSPEEIGRGMEGMERERWETLFRGFREKEASGEIELPRPPFAYGRPVFELDLTARSP